MRAAREHGATHVWANVLYLRPGTREHFMENLARDRRLVRQEVHTADPPPAAQLALVLSADAEARASRAA